MIQISKGGRQWGKNVTHDRISLYHITHINNLHSILCRGGLWCDAERLAQGWKSVNIAHKALKERRMKIPVPVAAGGMLGDYVPFYFCNRSPMLYAIHTGNVQGYSGGQAAVVYLVASLGQVWQGNRAWCFTDGHAVEAVTGFYDNVAALNKIDWNVIHNWSWRNTEEDNDRKRRKQAEFLVKTSFPWSWVEKIGVKDALHQAEVTAMLDAQAHHPSVVLEPKWYY